jgi:hypothetical protein
VDQPGGAGATGGASAARLRQLRTSRGLSQQRLARQLGVTAPRRQNPAASPTTPHNRGQHMNLRIACARRSAVPAIALAAAGLVLVGCGGSSGSAGAPAGSSTATHGSSTGSSSAALFPVAVGNTWVYRSTVSTLGEHGTVTDRMTAVVPVASGKRVTMTGTIQIPGASKNVTRAAYIFHSDGSITYPVSQLDSSGVSVVASNGILWPSAAQIASGQSHESNVELAFTTNGLSVKRTAHVTVRGAGSATVTVPAGTYHATIVDMTMTTSVDGFTVSIEVRTWLANGVGPVKSEAIIHEDGAMHVASVQELKSFSAG